jgi:uncharacterized protein (TIGR03437 family)
MQINVRLPADVASGNVPVRIFVGGAASGEGVTVAVK